MVRKSILIAVTSSLLLLAGCGDDGEAGSTTSSTTSTSTSSTSSTDAAPTSSPDGRIVVQVFFVDEEAFNQGVAPYVTPVEREVDATEPAAGALSELFAGPSPAEAAAGLRFVDSEATGFADLRIESGTAHVRLTGGCSSGGSTLTIANEIVPTLLQFSSVDSVKIYDPEGSTGRPEGPGDSIPFCLEP